MLNRDEKKWSSKQFLLQNAYNQKSRNLRRVRLDILNKYHKAVNEADIKKFRKSAVRLQVWVDNLSLNG